MVSLFRRLLIRTGMCLPFLLCAVIALTYAETLFAALSERFIDYGGTVIPNTPLAFFVASYFEYDILSVIITLIISIAVETCIYNKLACAYLCVNLMEKSFFDFEITIWWICAISAVNLIVSSWFTCKGLTILLRKS